MASRTSVITPKPIIQRSISFNAVPTDESSSSSSPTSSIGPSASNPASEAHTLKSSVSLPNCSTSSTPSISFAPLPNLEPRKRKSNIPLGVAARSRMIQQRRMMNGGLSRPPPMWTDLDEEAVNGPVDETDADDPFEVLGRYMMDKGKHFWRRVSQKAPIEPPPQTPSLKSRKRKTRDRHIIRDSTEVSGPNAAEQGGRVWEEEIGEDMQARIRRSSVVSVEMKSMLEVSKTSATPTAEQRAVPEASK